jgi:nucleotide-binding universal stress UspA family protein
MVSQRASGQFERILFPTDLTPGSDPAARYAMTLATHYKADLYVIHVIDTSGDAAGFYLPHISYENLDADMLEAGKGLLDKYCARHFEGLSTCHHQILEGESYKKVIAFAEEKDVDLIIMGAVAKGKLDHFFFGSTTERVMRKINRPVLVVPPVG